MLTADNIKLKTQFQTIEKALINIVNRKVSYELDSTKNLETHDNETIEL